MGDRRSSVGGRKASVGGGGGGGGGIFHRRTMDKRFVKHVTTLAHQPTSWTPMDLQEVECKLMEVRKYSAEYYDTDARFRRPNLELITAYTVQVGDCKHAFVVKMIGSAMLY